MLYLDHCATTPPHEDVVRAVTEVMSAHFGNPSSLHRLGVEAERLLTRSREVIAAGLHCKPNEIVFTSGGTESNNLALKGIAMRFRTRGRHIITSAVEHPSIYEAAKQLEETGFRVTYLPVDATGAVNAEDVQRAVTDDTVLVSLMHVNNETGRIQPVTEVGELLRRYPRVFFHVDAIQSLGKLELNPGKMGIDLLSASAHKIRGPKGAGFLYRREGVELMPLLAGGGQEQGARSGTENVPLIVGMAKAVRLAAENREQRTEQLYRLRERLVGRICAIPGLTVTGSPGNRDMAPHIVHFTLQGIRSEVVVHALEESGIYISTRSACASGSVQPSRVLLAMGMDSSRASNGLRVSFSAEQTADDLDEFAQQLKLASARLAGTR